MGKTSSKVKDKYNKNHYVQYNVRLKPETFQALKIFLQEKEISGSKFIELALKKLKEEKNMQLENIIDIEKQTEANNHAMKKIINFILE